MSVECEKVLETQLLITFLLLTHTTHTDTRTHIDIGSPR